MTSTAPQTPATTPPYPGAGTTWYVIGVLFLVTLFSQLDRQLPALLVGPLKQTFAISDTGFSLLQGYAFAFVYTLAGLPLGRYVDRANRRNLILIGLVFWSLMTAAGGFAQTYWQLFICRMGVGIGEACLAPAAYSMIADYVPPLKRGRAMGAYYVSLAIGAGASLFLGGLVLRALPEAGLGGLAPWRLMFVLAGLPGLAVALLLLTVKEPARRENARPDAGESQSVRAFIAHLRQHRGAFTSIYVYTTLMAIIGYATAAWAPACYVRHFGLSPADAGVASGVVLMLAGLAGSMTSATLSDRWLARGVPAARLRVTLIGWAVLIPASIAWPLLADLRLSLLCYGLTFFSVTFAQAAAAPVLQDIAPNAMRGQAIAVYLLFSGLLGIGFGPTAIALMNDRVFGPQGGLAASLVVVCAPLAVIGLLACWWGLKPYARTRHVVASALT